MLLEKAARSSLSLIHREVVAHEDVRGANMLFLPKISRVMLIDFERAALVERPHRRSPLALIPNKRGRIRTDKAASSTKEALASPPHARRPEQKIKREFALAKAICSS